MPLLFSLAVHNSLCCPRYLFAFLGDLACGLHPLNAQEQYTSCWVRSSWWERGFDSMPARRGCGTKR